MNNLRLCSTWFSRGMANLSASCIIGLDVTSVTMSLSRNIGLVVARVSPIWLSCVSLLLGGLRPAGCRASVVGRSDTRVSLG